MTKKSSRLIRQSTAPEGSFLGSFLGGFLDPIDVLSTIFFSVLFALLFTLGYGIFIHISGANLSFSSGYGMDLFIAILGAVTAWGIIDGVMYVMTNVFQRGERHRLLQSLQMADSTETAIEIMADELDFILEPITTDEQRHDLYLDISNHLCKGQPQKVGLQQEDVLGALATVLVSVLAVLPSLLPFLVLPNNTMLAIRISNLVSFVILFGMGYSWGKYTHTNPWRTGMFLIILGLIMALVACCWGDNHPNYQHEGTAQ